MKAAAPRTTAHLGLREEAPLKEGKQDRAGTDDQVRQGPEKPHITVAHHHLGPAT